MAIKIKSEEEKILRSLYKESASNDQGPHFENAQNKEKNTNRRVGFSVKQYIHSNWFSKNSFFTAVIHSKQGREKYLSIRQ